MKKIKDSIPKFDIYFLFLQFIFLNHAFSCLWIFINQFYDRNDPIYLNYVTDDPYNDYVNAFYFGITILTTAGYGDINGKSIIQRLTIIIYIFLGVILYSFVIEEFSRIIFNTDQDSVALENKVLKVRQYQREYNLLPFVGDKVVQ